MMSVISDLINGKMDQLRKLIERNTTKMVPCYFIPIIYTIVGFIFLIVVPSIIFTIMEGICVGGLSVGGKLVDQLVNFDYLTLFQIGILLTQYIIHLYLYRQLVLVILFREMTHQPNMLIMFGTTLLALKNSSIPSHQKI